MRAGAEYRHGASARPANGARRRAKARHRSRHSDRPQFAIDRWFAIVEGREAIGDIYKEIRSTRGRNPAPHIGVLSGSTQFSSQATNVLQLP